MISIIYEPRQMRRIIENLKTTTETLLEKGDKTLYKAMNEIVLPKAKELAPVGDPSRDPFLVMGGPGTLRRSLHVVRLGWLRFAIADGVDYGIYQELGYSITEKAIATFRRKMKRLGIPIRPELAKGPHFVKRPFLVPAFRGSVGEIRNLLKKELEV